MADDKYFVTVTDIRYGYLDVNEDGQEVNKVLEVPAGTKLSASEIGDDEFVAHLLELGSIAEFKDVIVVEDTARIEALEAESAEKDALIAKLQAELAAKNTPQQ